MLPQSRDLLLRNCYCCCHPIPEGITSLLGQVMSCHQTVIIPINLFTVLWLQNVPVPEAGVVEEKAVYNDLRNEVNITSRALRNMERYLVFSTPNALSTTLLAQECLALNLSWVGFWLGWIQAP